MRWNCPHCGVNLAVSDDKLGAGWSFSRCYKCGGFALIRRAEVNLVKVDRAPAGEHIILPEATEEPTTMLSEEALQNLSRLRRDSAEKAATRAAMSRHAAAIQQHLANPLNAVENQNQHGFPQFPPRVLQPIESTQTIAMPGPLPEVRAKLKKGIRPLPIAIGAAGLMTIASGAYLYIQGQALWEKARTPIVAEQTEARAYRPVSARSNEAVPAPAIALKDNRIETSDQIKNTAMAPERTEEPSAPGLISALPKIDVAAVKAETAPNRANTDANAVPAKTTASLLVQPRVKNADMHSGPGSLYPIVGMANPKKQYLVTDWNDRWFRVILKEDTLKAAMPRMAWIRTDLVQVVPAGTDSLPPYP